MIFLVPFFVVNLTVAQGLETQKIKIGGKKHLTVEVAKSFSDRNKGLMNRTELGKNSGMLFVFETPRKLSFWMKDTYIPLSIAYFDKNRVLKEIYHMKPQSMMEKNQDLRSYPSQNPCLYALEVNRGWFKENGIKVGDKFEFINAK